MGVAGELVVARRRRCPASSSSSRLDLTSQPHARDPCHYSDRLLAPPIDCDMPTRTALHRAVRRIFHQSPAIEAATLGLLDVWCRVALLPFRRARRHGQASEDASLVTATDRYNRAAEQYFATIDDPSFLIGKPFSEPAALPKHLIDAGVLLSALRVAPGDVVMEIGAGSCWLSHMLNRYG